MIISLCYVDGISRKDTPYFENIAEQISYFNNTKVSAIERSFYPPHYKDEIKIDDSEIDFNTEINYVRFQYLSKWYYYFIDNIIYISESVIKLEITMDYIQTYMFNIRINSGNIERKFINRWYKNNNQWYINRNYIRENFSNNEFVPYRYKEIVPEGIRGWFCFKSSTEFVGSTTNNGQSYKFKNIQARTNYVVYMVPDIDGEFDVYDDDNNSTLVINNGQMWIALQNLIDEPTIYECCYVPYNVVGSQNGLVSINYDTKEIHIRSSILNYFRFTPGVGDNNQGLAFRMRGNTNLMELLQTYTFAVNRNIFTQNLYNSYFITQMFDDNYYRFTYGEKSSVTTVNLYNAISSTITCKYWFDLSSSKRFFNISVVNSITDYTVSEYGNSDILNNTVIGNCDATYDLLNDAYKEWRIYNKGAEFFTYTKDLGKLAMLAGIGAAVHPYIKTFDTRPITGSIGDTISDSYDLFAKKFNLKLTPDTFKASNQVFANIIGNLMKQFYRIDKVNDFEHCAQLYHKLGFLVNEHVSSLQNVFSYVHNRYYFNILKMNMINIHLVNCIESENIISSIENRLKEGIVLWNKDFEIGSTYIYDNVEIDFLED